MFRYIYGGKMSSIVYLFHFHDFINTRLYGILNVFLDVFVWNIYVYTYQIT